MREFILLWMTVCVRGKQKVRFSESSKSNAIRTVEDLLDGSRNDTTLLAVGESLHRVGLAGTGLTVRDDGCVVALKGAG
jgi:hypothetical protein